jgi:hypothetical protein
VWTLVSHTKGITLIQDVSVQGVKGKYLDLRKKWRGAEKGCIMRSFITCILHKILLGLSYKGI